MKPAARRSLLLCTAIGCLAPIGVTAYAGVPRATPPTHVIPVETPSGSPGLADESAYLSAVSAIDQRDYGRALELLQDARDRQPNDIRVLNAFGVIYDKLGRFDLSARYYAQAAKLDPSSIIVQNNVAYSRRLQGLPESPAPSALADATSSAQAALAGATGAARPAPIAIAPAPGLVIARAPPDAIRLMSHTAEMQLASLPLLAPSPPQAAIAGLAIAAAPTAAVATPLPPVRAAWPAEARAAHVDVGALAAAPVSFAPAPVLEAPSQVVTATAAPARLARPATPAAIGSAFGARNVLLAAALELPQALPAESAIASPVRVAEAAPRATEATFDPAFALQKVVLIDALEPLQAPPAQPAAIAAPVRMAEAAPQAATRAVFARQKVVLIDALEPLQAPSAQPAAIAAPVRMAQAAPQAATRAVFAPEGMVLIEPFHSVQAAPAVLAAMAPPLRMTVATLQTSATTGLVSAPFAPGLMRVDTPVVFLPAEAMAPAAPSRARLTLATAVAPSREVQRAACPDPHAARSALAASAAGPHKTGRVASEARPALATLRLGRQLTLVNASGQALGAERVRAVLAHHGWSRPTLLAYRHYQVSRTTIRYAPEAAGVARALARTLPGHATLVACSHACVGIRLVIGADYMTWRATPWELRPGRPSLTHASAPDTRPAIDKPHIAMSRFMLHSRSLS